MLVLGKAEDIHGPKRARLERRQRMPLIIDGRPQRCEMEDGVDGPIDTPGAGDVFDAEAEARSVNEVADVAPAAGDQAVDADDLGTVSKEAVGEMRPEESRAAGH